jgi:hypothetical protein
MKPTHHVCTTALKCALGAASKFWNKKLEFIHQISCTRGLLNMHTYDFQTAIVCPPYVVPC